MHVSRHRALIICLCTLLAGSAGAADAPAPWKTSASAGARTVYDSNVFLQDNSAVIAPNGEPANAGSLVGSVSLSLGATWTPSPALAFDAGYSPEFTRYERFRSEDHDDHRLTAGLCGRAGRWSYDLKGGLLIVDGSSLSPIYGHVGGSPAVGGEPVRSRRDQTATKGSAKITCALGPRVFVRAVGAACFQDFQTVQKPTTGPGAVPGYANYVDRSEWSVGTDAGCFVRKDLALVTGVRIGEQRQANLLGVKNNCSNTLTRLLVGIEGKVLPTLSLSILAGPDMRRFTDSAVTPGFDRTRTTRYAEASATWTPGPADSVGFSMKDFLWLPGGGRGTYGSTAYDLIWKHMFTKTWGASLDFNVQGADNVAYAPPAGQCDDVIYAVSAGVTCALNAKTSLEAGVTREWSDSAIANKPGREYVRLLVSAGAKYTF